MLDLKIKHIDNLVGKPFLSEVQKTWDLMKLFIRWTVTLFHPIQNYTAAYETCTLPQSALNILKEKLILKYSDRITTELFKEFQKERAHDQVDLTLNKDSFNYFLIVDYGKDGKIVMKDTKFQYVYEGKPDKQEVKTFDTFILDKLLKETKEFYSRFVHNNSNLSVIDFLDQANMYLEEERERVKNYYPIPDFRDQVWKTLTKELIEKPGNDLISRPGDGLFNMLKGDNKKYAKLLYHFITEIRFDLSKFIAEIVEYIKYRIKEITEKDVKDAGEQSSYLIGELIKFRSYLEDLVKDCFGNNAEIK